MEIGARGQVVASYFVSYVIISWKETHALFVVIICTFYLYSREWVIFHIPQAQLGTHKYFHSSFDHALELHRSIGGKHGGITEPENVLF
jgi:hypothetical protein